MESTIIPDKSLFRPDEVAKIFSVSIRTVNNWRNEGKLEGKRISYKIIRYQRSELVQLINKKTPEGA